MLFAAGLWGFRHAVHQSERVMTALSLLTAVGAVITLVIFFVDGGFRRK